MIDALITEPWKVVLLFVIGGIYSVVPMTTTYAAYGARQLIQSLNKSATLKDLTILCSDIAFILITGFLVFLPLFLVPRFINFDCSAPGDCSGSEWHLWALLAFPSAIALYFGLRRKSMKDSGV